MGITDDRQLISSRQSKICELVQRDGQVFITELAKDFSVSVETVRRDINFLHKSGMLRKVYGGAVPVYKNAQEAAYSQRADTEQGERQAIGRYAAGLIKDGDVIALDSGVTIDSLACAISGVKNITILLNSVSALNILMKKQAEGDFNGELIFLGGSVHCESRHTVGSIPTALLERFSVDKAFLSATAVSAAGLRMYDAEEGMYTALLIKQAAESCLLASSSKFGKEALYRICGFEAVRHIVTDGTNPIPALIKKSIEQAGAALHICDQNDRP